MRRFSKQDVISALVALLALGVAAGATIAGFLVGGISSTTLFLHALAFAGVGIALFKARRANIWSDKISGEIDAISGRLLRVEARMSEVDRQGGGGSRSTLAEVTGEIALLGNLVRDLTVTVASHDRVMAELNQHKERPPERWEEDWREAVSDGGSPAPDWAPPPPQPMPAWPVRAAVAAPAPVDEVRPPAPSSRFRDAAPEVQPPVPAREAPPLPAPAPVAPPPESVAVAPAPVPVPPEPPLVARRQEPLASDVAETRRIGAMVEAFEADRIELHLQPVVSLPQRKVRFYEALARLRLSDGSLLVPAEFLPQSERVGLVAELDRRVIARACAIARHLMARGSEAIVSCNLSPQSLAEAGFLRSVGRVLEAYPDVTGRLVIEISQRCWRTLDAERAGALASLRDRGVPFALDRATDLRLDPLALADRGVRYVKLPVEMLLRPDTSRGLDIEMTDLSAVLARAGIRLVCERVEREDDVPDLIDLDVPLAQGFVFAPPRAVRADVVGAPGLREDGQPPAEPAASSVRPEPGDPLRPPAVPSGEDEERRPYRAFLRRAS